MIGWALLVLLACGTPDRQAAAPPAPEPFGIAACAVCGMVVREQPAPRGQVVLRSGDHLHFCSIGDLRAWMAAPSPHGPPVATYVEALPAGFDPQSKDLRPHPWIPIQDAWFVFGMTRPEVMGVPTLTFADDSVARQAAAPYGSTPVKWDNVRNLPFHAVPGAAEEPR